MLNIYKYILFSVILLAVECYSAPPLKKMGYFNGKNNYKSITFTPPPGAAIFTIIFRFKLNVAKLKYKSFPLEIVPLEMNALDSNGKENLNSVKFFWVFPSKQNSYFSFRAFTWDYKHNKKILPRLNIVNFPIEKKHWIAAVFGGGAFKLYFDGTDISTQRKPEYFPYCFNPQKYNLRIGSSSWRGGTCFFPGWIGNVSIFAKLLTSKDIRAYQNGKKTPKVGVDGLLIKW